MHRGVEEFEGSAGAARRDHMVTRVAPASNGVAAASGACGDAQPEEKGAKGGVPGDPKLTRSAMEGSGRPEEARDGRISRRRAAAGAEVHDEIRAIGGFPSRVAR